MAAHAASEAIDESDGGACCPGGAAAAAAASGLDLRKKKREEEEEVEKTKKWKKKKGGKLERWLLFPTQLSLARARALFPRTQQATNDSPGPIAEQGDRDRRPRDGGDAVAFGDNDVAIDHREE